tara:strand:- start:146 stop:844 length:699 start_codon:yes stop_codon:yes gene_type:complete
MRKVCIIPARGGSKRIKNKNSKLFFGEPLLIHAAKIASGANLFDKIMVSTDDRRVLKLCISNSIDTSFPRPSELSDDYAPVYDVMKHEIGKLHLENDDIVCCLYATAVLLRPELLQKAYERLTANTQSSYCFGVTSFDFPPQRALTKDNADNIKMIDESHFFTRSQDLEKIWHDTGTFYFARVREWMSEKFTFNNRSIGLEIKPTEAQDIDDEYDWKLAEMKYSLMHGNQNG